MRGFESDIKNDVVSWRDVYDVCFVVVGCIFRCIVICGCRFVYVGVVEMGIGMRCWKEWSGWYFDSECVWMIVGVIEMKNLVRWRGWGELRLEGIVIFIILRVSIGLFGIFLMIGFGFFWLF